MPAAHGHASGSARTRRKRAQEHGGEEGGAERWLVTYADMLTLLLVLFIVLFSISIVNKSKFAALRSSLSSVFGQGSVGATGSGTTPDYASSDGQNGLMPGFPTPASRTPSTTSPSPSPSAASVAHAQAVADQAADFAQAQQRIDAALKAAGLEQSAKVTIDDRGLVITVVTDALVFGPNSADLQQKGQQIVNAVAPALVSEPRRIEVDGYTNQLNVSTGPYPSGWELSGARASSVVRLLISDGVNASHLGAEGFSDQRPLYPASDPRSVTLNRRVEIVILSALATGS